VSCEAGLLLYLRIQEYPDIVALGRYLERLGANKVTLEHGRISGGAEEFDRGSQGPNRRDEAESAMIGDSALVEGINNDAERFELCDQGSKNIRDLSERRARSVLFVLVIE